MPTGQPDPRAEAIAVLFRDRRLAHRRLFSHRHFLASAPYQDLLIDDWHAKEQRICWIAFRGSAKSTIGEEGIILNLCFREFNNVLMLGSSLDRACERLH